MTPKALPTAMVRGKSSSTSSGSALVATSASLSRRFSSRSRTQPPTSQAWCPAARSRATTSTPLVQMPVLSPMASLETTGRPDDRTTGRWQ
jgi:hypothetical protein